MLTSHSEVFIEWWSSIVDCWRSKRTGTGDNGRFGRSRMRTTGRPWHRLCREVSLFWTHFDAIECWFKKCDFETIFILGVSFHAGSIHFRHSSWLWPFMSLLSLKHEENLSFSKKMHNFSNPSYIMGWVISITYSKIYPIYTKRTF